MVDAPTSYPLRWPVGWPRARSRNDASFHRKKPGEYGDVKVKITMAQARAQLQGQLDLLRARAVVLSTNVELNLNGDPRGDRARPDDVGVACYFQLNNHPTVLACDRWTRVEDNIVAIAKHIDAMRGQDRWGVGSIEQAFAGYAALPAPVTRRHWTAVLGVSENASLDVIQGAYRTAAKAAGTDQDRLYELNMARDEAVAARSLT